MSALIQDQCSLSGESQQRKGKSEVGKLDNFLNNEVSDYLVIVKVDVEFEVTTCLFSSFQNLFAMISILHSPEVGNLIPSLALWFQWIILLL